MALTAGTRLSPYEIRDQIGAGGMGEVYRATDTQLDRAVAIKVLPEHLADDPQRRERFEREAKAVSSLNHPHICTLHDIGEQDGVHYLVMEYVEGKTLQQRLEKGRLPAVDGSYRNQVSTDGGVEAVWCDTCNAVFYRDGNRIRASRITTEPSVSIDTPQEVFFAEDFIDTSGRSFDVSPDGERVYYVRRSTRINRTRINVIVNWFQELKERVPVP